MAKRTMLITGASSGIGKACAAYFSKNGYKVYGTSRNADFPPKSISDDFVMIKMDVDNDESVRKAIDYIVDVEDSIDIVINNAGWGVSGAIEDISISDVKALFETNFFGSYRVCLDVLANMRKNRKGFIINISSIGGVLGLPYQGVYSATKFAIEGFTEALRMEVKPFGIHVVLVEPGDFKTSFTSKRKKITSLKKKSDYFASAERTLSIVEHDEQQGSSPEKIVMKIDKILHSSNPRVRYRVGSFSQTFAASLKGKVSDRFIQWVLMKYYKV